MKRENDLHIDGFNYIHIYISHVLGQVTVEQGLYKPPFLQSRFYNLLISSTLPATQLHNKTTTTSEQDSSGKYSHKSSDPLIQTQKQTKKKKKKKHQTTETHHSKITNKAERTCLTHHTESMAVQKKVEFFCSQCQRVQYQDLLGSFWYCRVCKKPTIHSS